MFLLVINFSHLDGDAAKMETLLPPRPHAV
jgi:hypothetical protein